jgi:aryl-alcohol dehydrogenase-like predicted oxidoreductase
MRRTTTSRFASSIERSTPAVGSLPQERRRAHGAVATRADAADALPHVAAENQRKLDAAEVLAQLAEQACITLIELAVAFVIRHPAVTAAIIGPRTMEHLES